MNKVYVTTDLPFIHQLVEQHKKGDVHYIHDTNIISKDDIIITQDLYTYNDICPVIFLSPKQKYNIDDHNNACKILNTPIHPISLFTAITDIFNGNICNKNESNPVIHLENGYKILIDKKIVLDDQNNDISLTEKETQILDLLIQKQNYSKQELLEHVWEHEQCLETVTLSTHIYRLRKKIGDNNNAILCSNNGIYYLNYNKITYRG